MVLDAYCTPGTERDTNLPAAELLRQMNEAGVHMAVVAPEDREMAVANAAGNDRMLRLASEYPDRYVPACSVSPWYGHEATRELRRAAGAGARLLALAPAVQGFIPTDPFTGDLFECAAELNLPVYIHTGPQSCGCPSQVVLLAEMHPRTNFIIGHCGTTDHSWDMPSILEHHLRENLWFELSFVRPWAAANYIRLAGARQFIWGSSAPRSHPGYELAQHARYLPVEAHREIYGENLARLLGISMPS
jgi:uncharacterized protein